MPESRSLSYSIVLHAALLLIAAFGLPALFTNERELEPMVMTVDILPVSAMTNVKPSDQPIQKLQEANVTKNAKPVPPTAQEKPKPAEEKHFDPTEGDEAKPKEEEKPKEDPKPDDFAKLLSKLSQEDKAKPKEKAKDKTSAEENATRSDAAYDDSVPLSLSEKDAIRNQFIKCWAMPAGAKDAATLVVKLRVELNQDGSLISSALNPDQLARYSSDSFFRAAADSAKRAVVQCTQPPLGPLKDLPPDKYGSWRSMELTFDPAQMVGGITPN